jgi:alpha-N-acetylglucosamine transferase
MIVVKQQDKSKIKAEAVQQTLPAPVWEHLDLILRESEATGLQKNTFWPPSNESVSKAFQFLENIRHNSERRNKFAYVIYYNNKSRSKEYFIYCLALIQSWKRSNSIFPLVVMSTLTAKMPKKVEHMLTKLGVKKIHYIADDMPNVKTWSSNWDKAFFKLYALRLTQYEKVLLLDVDTIILQNTDEIFGYETPAAALEPCRGCAVHPKRGLGEGLNGGVYLLKPSLQQYVHLKNTVIGLWHNVIPKGDQQIMLYLWTKAREQGGLSERYHLLPFIYNTSPYECPDLNIVDTFPAALPPSFNMTLHAKIVHFIWFPKPIEKKEIIDPYSCSEYPYLYHKQCAREALDFLQLKEDDIPALLRNFEE